MSAQLIHTPESKRVHLGTFAMNAHSGHDGYRTCRPVPICSTDPGITLWSYWCGRVGQAETALPRLPRPPRRVLSTRTGCLYGGAMSGGESTTFANEYQGILSARCGRLDAAPVVLPTPAGAANPRSTTTPLRELR